MFLHVTSNITKVQLVKIVFHKLIIQLKLKRFVSWFELFLFLLDEIICYIKVSMEFWQKIL